MSFTFAGANAFNQDISSWDVSNVTDMDDMFGSADVFNQDLGSWDISSLSTATSMFSNSGMSTENYSRTLIGWANSAYAGNAPSNVDFRFQSNMNYNNTAYTTGNQFNDAVSARSYLVNTKNWDISGDTQV